MKKFAVVLLAMMLVPLLGAEKSKAPVTQDISQYGERDGRVIGAIQRPDWGANVYMGMMDISGISNPILKLFSFTTNRPVNIQITAINFDTGDSERFMVRVSPDDERTINLKSLEGKYTHLDFCSMTSYSAEILDQQTGKTYYLEIPNLEYKPLGSSAEYNSIVPPHASSSTSRSLQSSDPIYTLCLGKWQLICASSDICGNFQEFGYGKIRGRWPAWSWCMFYHIDYSKHIVLNYWSHPPLTQFPYGKTWYWDLMGNMGDPTQCPWRTYRTESGAYYWVIPQGPKEPGKPY